VNKEVVGQQSVQKVEEIDRERGISLNCFMDIGFTFYESARRGLS
jgi:hypothetical protein